MLFDRGRVYAQLKLTVDFPYEQINEQLVKIVAAEMCVAVGGQHFKGAIFQSQDGNIKGASAQVVHRNCRVLLAIQSIGQCGGGRLVDNAHHVPTRNLTRVARRLSLCVVELCGNGDDRAPDIPPDVLFRTLL